jgi:hypothetical protein
MIFIYPIIRAFCKRRRKTEVDENIMRYGMVNACLNKVHGAAFSGRDSLDELVVPSSRDLGTFEIVIGWVSRSIVYARMRHTAL